MKVWRVLEVIKTSTEYLAKRNVPDPRLDAEYLLGHVLHCKRLDLYMIFDQPLAQTELISYRELIKRRGQREPLQHILGATEFMGLTLQTTSAALIPRMETEVLVEQILARHAPGPLRILDIGTGSGCISLALATQRPQWQLSAMDISPPALDLARQNAERLALNGGINFFKCDILHAFPDGAPFDIIVSNPPYISKGELDTLEPEVRDHDPKLALLAEKRGLEFYQRFAEIFKVLLRPEGSFYLEFGGAPQEQVLLDLFAQAGFKELEVIPDLNQTPRILIGHH